MPPAADQHLDDLSCYTGALHEDGYINGLCGKWHLGDSPNPQHGFHTGLLYRLVVVVTTMQK